VSDASHIRGVKLRRARSTPISPGTSATVGHCSADDSMQVTVSAVVPADFTESASFINYKHLITLHFSHLRTKMKIKGKGVPGSTGSEPLVTSHFQ